MSRVARLALASLVATGCAALNHEPGMPYGGAYCTQRGGDPEPACYPTEVERSAAWRAREAEGRRAWAAEHPAEAEALASARARARSDFEERQRRTAQAAADDAAARAARDERQEQDRAAARAARDERLARADAAHARAAEPAYAVPALSAIVCRYEADAAELRALLKREARITALSGVVDRRARLGIANELDNDQEKSAGRRAELRQRFGASPLPCGQLEPVLACHAREDACEPSARDVVDVWRVFDHQL